MNATYLFDADDQMVAELRGWGRLTGTGGGLGLSKYEAFEIQRQRGQAIVDALNDAATLEKVRALVKELASKLTPEYDANGEPCDQFASCRQMLDEVRALLEAR
jgi:hypothetical protein